MQLFYILAYSLVREVDNMVVKINKKPIMVTEEAKETVNIVAFLNIGLYGLISLVSAALINKVAYLFTGVTPFPALRWVEGIFKWFS
jgi:hypothetical protein